jgi:hypothetical protein
VEILPFFLLIWFLPAIVTGFVASGRGRSGIGWFFIGLVLGWIALILIFVLPSPTNPMPVNVMNGPVDSTSRQPCPRCGESIPVAARMCRFCGHELGA